MLKVTFQPKDKGYEDKEIVEYFDMTPHANGFVPDYKLRAMALNWRILQVQEV